MLLGTTIRTLNSQWIYGHGGEMVYRSQLYYVPEESLSISVIANQHLVPTYYIWLDLYNTYMTVTSEIEYHEPVLVQVYPNPVKDIATFSTEKITSFEIYDMKGTLIIKRTDNKIDMSNLKPGIYFVIGFHCCPLKIS